MSENSSIGWTDHTFNSWWGCVKVHAGCTHCYAESFDKRVGGSHWGNGPRRMILGEWGKPAKWNAEAIEKFGRRARVFFCSMCDLFEDYNGPVVDQQGNPVPIPGDTGHWTVPALRQRVFNIIEKTPNLTPLLLTKRPENIRAMVPHYWLDNWPEHVWTGTSPCNQETADACIPDLLSVPGRHFLSCEPLIGPLDLLRVKAGALCPQRPAHRVDVLRGGTWDLRTGMVPARELPEFVNHSDMARIEWVIVGGESGKARPCNVAWIRSVVKQCGDSGTPCFVKQLGSNVVCRNDEISDWLDECSMSLDCVETEGVRMQGDLVTMVGLGRKGDNPDLWPSDLRVQNWPESMNGALHAAG